MGMPHYYFHIFDRGKVIPDEDGMQLANLAAARIEANLSAAGMLDDALDEGNDISHQIIEVTDSTGHVFALVALLDWSKGPAVA
jgi:hypothetical protein